MIAMYKFRVTTIYSDFIFTFTYIYTHKHIYNILGRRRCKTTLLSTSHISHIYIYQPEEAI